ncbi:hypothetical protein C8Q79DRAFT_948181 [Trametes meyenii]|nr:hypothetical protein C8Q79DRAFT_948181 [Trametes meyenii]
MRAASAPSDSQDGSAQAGRLSSPCAASTRTRAAGCCQVSRVIECVSTTERRSAYGSIAASSHIASPL